jgi:hypothetical protein
MPAEVEVLEAAERALESTGGDAGLHDGLEDLGRQVRVGGARPSSIS